MSGLTLAKNKSLSLAKAAPKLRNAVVGLGWDMRRGVGQAFDLDASLFLLGANGKVRSDADFIFYNQPSTFGGEVIHNGDNRTGAGDGDDETLNVFLNRLPADVLSLAVVLSIHESVYNFGQVENAYARIVDADTGEEVVRVELNEAAALDNAIVLAHLNRDGNEWVLHNTNLGFSGGLEKVANSFGVFFG